MEGREANRQPLRWATKKDWDDCEEFVRTLYEKLTLREIMEMVEERYHFKATENMYKKRMSKWRIGKRNREPEMRAIVRKYLDRMMQGKWTVAKVRGQTLDYTEVERYWQRKGFSMAEVIATRMTSTTPEGLKCATPEASPTFQSRRLTSGAATPMEESIIPQTLSKDVTPFSSPIDTPESLATPERILEAVCNYCMGSFESKRWFLSDPESPYGSKEGTEEAVYDLYDLALSAFDLLARSAVRDAGQLLNTAYAKFDDVLLAECPTTLRLIFQLVLVMPSGTAAELVPGIFQYISRLAEIHPGIQHSRFLASFAASESERIWKYNPRILKDGGEKILGPLRLSILSLILGFLRQGETRRDGVALN